MADADSEEALSTSISNNKQEDQNKNRDGPTGSEVKIPTCPEPGDTVLPDTRSSVAEEAKSMELQCPRPSSANTEHKDSDIDTKHNVKCDIVTPNPGNRPVEDATGSADNDADRQINESPDSSTRTVVEKSPELNPALNISGEGENAAVDRVHPADPVVAEDTAACPEKPGDEVHSTETKNEDVKVGEDVGTVESKLEQTGGNLDGSVEKDAVELATEQVTVRSEDDGLDAKEKEIETVGCVDKSKKIESRNTAEDKTGEETTADVCLQGNKACVDSRKDPDYETETKDTTEDSVQVLEKAEEQFQRNDGSAVPKIDTATEIPAIGKDNSPVAVPPTINVSEGEEECQEVEPQEGTTRDKIPKYPGDDVASMEVDEGVSSSEEMKSGKHFKPPDPSGKAGIDNEDSAMEVGDDPVALEKDSAKDNPANPENKDHVHGSEGKDEDMGTKAGSMEEMSEKKEHDESVLDEKVDCEVKSGVDLKLPSEEGKSAKEEVKVPSKDLEVSSEGLKSGIEKPVSTTEVLTSTLRELRTTSEELTSTAEELESTSNELTSTSKELKCTGKGLTSTSKDSTSTSKELVSPSKELKCTGKELESTSKELESTSKELECGGKELASTSKELESTSKELGSTGKELKSASHEFASTSKELDVSEGLKSTTEELASASRELTSTSEELPSESKESDVSKELKSATEDVKSSSEELTSTSNELNTSDGLASTTEELASTSKGLKSTSEELTSRANELNVSDVLKSTIEDVKPVNEELKSPNKELKSSTTELTPTSEELKSTSEELKSTSEELTSTTQELESKAEGLKEGSEVPELSAKESNSTLLDGTSSSTKELILTSDESSLTPGELKLTSEDQTQTPDGSEPPSKGLKSTAEDSNVNSKQPETGGGGDPSSTVLPGNVSENSSQCEQPKESPPGDEAETEKTESAKEVGVPDVEELDEDGEGFGMQGITILNVRSMSEDVLMSANQDEEAAQVEESEEKSPKDEADPDTVVISDSENAEPGSKEDSAAEVKDDKKVKAGAPGKLCTICQKTKSCKYQVLMEGETKFICNDECFRVFSTRQKISKTTVSQFVPENRPVTRSLTHPKDFCNMCSKEIKNGQGLLPGVGEHKPLCSEECMKNYQAKQGLKRACAQCGGTIQGRNKCLTWETMEFCNEDCLGKYQSFLGSNCACCRSTVQRTSLGKYCVRFGSDIKQFCSNKCLEEFKKGLKVCSFCQKDISRSSEGFIAPVGDKGLFKEFCSQTCMEKYETMGAVTPAQPSIRQCSVCNKMAQVKVEFVFEGKSHRLCSESCVAAFRYANKINTSICDSCHKFFDLDVSHQLTIQFEGTCKRFCSKTCTNVFVLYRRKVVPCTWCKVKKYNFDMIERVDSNNHVQLFCSLNCLSLFRVSLNATSSRSVRCDFCRLLQPAQYHLTMSDASIRNFCSYNCVMQFQSQFTSITPVLPPQPLAGTVAEGATATSVMPHTTVTVASVATSSETLTCMPEPLQGTPLISSVVSLAPGIILACPSTSTACITTSTESLSPPAGTLTATVARLPSQTPCQVTVSTATPVQPHPVSVKTASCQTAVSQSSPITQQVVTKAPVPKLQKNKMLLCKPLMQTKGVSCKPHPCHKGVQTESLKPLIIPIPVPIYIPVLVNMFPTPVAYPWPMPVPIPVPLFLHKPRLAIDQGPVEIPDAPDFVEEPVVPNERVPTPVPVADPVPAKEVAILECGKIPEVMESPVMATRKRQSRVGGKKRKLATPDTDSKEDTEALAVKSVNEKVDFAVKTPEPKGLSEDPVSSRTNPIKAQMVAPLSIAVSSPEVASKGAVVDENGDVTSPRQLRARTRVQKRSSTRGGGRSRSRKKSRHEVESEECVSTEEDNSRGGSAMMDENSQQLMADANMTLKYSYGVNAWKYWVLQKNMQLEKASQTNRKLKLFKTDLLQLTADELNYSLCLFVKEVRKPNGEEYAPDSVYYLCLGIQQYLFENSRLDNIFTDAYYEKFTECLNEVLQKHETLIHYEGPTYNRIEEEVLWECKQLGAHSPHVLLNTLMFFNSKYFRLNSVDEHAQLSFTQLMRHARKHAELPRKGKESTPAVSPFDHFENHDNPLRCPVKLYEFYLSKCPEGIKNRNDAFYLHPERACVPDSVVWYSTQTLGKDTVTKMLQRIKMVRF